MRKCDTTVPFTPHVTHCHNNVNPLTPSDFIIIYGRPSSLKQTAFTQAQLPYGTVTDNLKKLAYIKPAQLHNKQQYVP